MRTMYSSINRLMCQDACVNGNKAFIYQTLMGLDAGWMAAGAEMDGLVTGVKHETATSQHNLFIPAWVKRWGVPFPRRVHVTDK